MKKIIIFLLIFQSIQVQSQYFDFPFVGWKQTYTSYIWTGVSLETGVGSFGFDRDTLLNGQNYITDGYGFYRSDQGKIYQNKYDWQTETYTEQLEYDFTLEIGELFTNYNFTTEDSVTVINKERIINMLGDSVWQLELQYKLNWIVYDTLIWLEGVGNLNSGLIKTNFPDGGFQHACTLLSDNRKLSTNPFNTSYCNCTYVYGTDMDNDGFGNYIPRVVEIDLGFHFDNPSARKNYKARACDTLRILSPDLDNIYFSSDANCENILAIDEINMLNDTFYYTIYDISSYDKIYLSDQCAWNLAEINLFVCFENDCDDTDPLINALQAEIPYNGIDDDCDALTLEDDLDQDGFKFVDDCDDTDPLINPNAIDIPNNGIDEDCDGEDVVTSTHDFENSKLSIYPNPVSSVLIIRSDKNFNFMVDLYKIDGTQVFSARNVKAIPVHALSKGIYLLKIHNIDSKEVIHEKIVIH